MSWQDLIDFEETHEIFTEYPYAIRKKSTGLILSESLNGDNYYCVSINGKSVKKHRLVAKQFIPNPYNLPCVDHINRDRTDNHLFNLRWCTSSENAYNRTSSNNNIYTYVDYDEAPNDLLEIVNYGKHEYKNYFYSPSEDQFYYKNDLKLRIIIINYDKKENPFICVIDKMRKKRQIYCNKFKKLYGLV